MEYLLLIPFIIAVAVLSHTEKQRSKIFSDLALEAQWNKEETQSIESLSPFEVAYLSSKGDPVMTAGVVAADLIQQLNKGVILTNSVAEQELVNYVQSELAAQANVAHPDATHWANLTRSLFACVFGNDIHKFSFHLAHTRTKELSANLSYLTVCQLAETMALSPEFVAYRSEKIATMKARNLLVAPERTERFRSRLQALEPRPIYLTTKIIFGVLMGIAGISALFGNVSGGLIGTIANVVAAALFLPLVVGIFYAIWVSMCNLPARFCYAVAKLPPEIFPGSKTLTWALTEVSPNGFRAELFRALNSFSSAQPWLRAGLTFSALLVMALIPTCLIFFFYLSTDWWHLLPMFLCSAACIASFMLTFRIRDDIKALSVPVPTELARKKLAQLQLDVSRSSPTLTLARSLNATNHDTGFSQLVALNGLEVLWMLEEPQAPMLSARPTPLRSSPPKHQLQSNSNDAG